MYEVILYETASGRIPIKEYLEKLAKESKTSELAQIISFKERLEKHGMAVDKEFPRTIRKIRDDIYELRPGKNRVFFFYYIDNKFVLLHAYRKHSEKAPKSEIDKAVKEMKDFIKRKNDI